jgi:hypothetical protein
MEADESYGGREETEETAKRETTNTKETESPGETGYWEFIDVERGGTGAI